MDLGCGNGIQSVSFAKLGFEVFAIDFNKQLLSELEVNRKNLTIQIIEDDIINIKQYAKEKPEVIICWGVTLFHLNSQEQIVQFIADCSKCLCQNGKFILPFRDYSHTLTGEQRFIPVKSDASNILTCCLDFEDNRVSVTDILYTKTDENWTQRISSYYKVRMIPFEVEKRLTESGFTIKYNEVLNRMQTIIAEKI